ncbi:C6 transcription factor [Verticillium dahliae]
MPPLSQQDASNKPLSCANCRQRKIKCDKIEPRCTQCTRSALDCVFPARKRTRKPRQARQSELLNRIHRLESIVGQVESAAAAKPPLGTLIKAESDAPHAQEQKEAPGNAVTNAGSATTSRETSVAPNNYLSSDFWSNLCDEVDGIKQALDQSSESDNSDDDEGLFFSSESPSQTHTSPVATSGLITTFSGDINSYGPQHPSQAQIRHLSRTYFTNVDPVIKILHRPTAAAELTHFADSLDAKTISNDTAALFFAMYYAAATSMSHEECLLFLSEDRSSIIRRYQQNLERALHRADYLCSSKLKTIQAFTIYVAVLRSHGASRSSWALLGLLIRLAQGQGLHREGALLPNLSPYETELRRRLWWMIIVLDVRAAEDRGTEVIILPGSYDTHMVANINDEDFGPDTLTKLVDRSGPTDMSFGYATAMASGTLGSIKHPPIQHLNPDINDAATLSSVSSPALGTASNSPTEEVIVRQAQRLEALFLTSPTAPSLAIDSHPAAGPAAITTRVIILKLWLSLQYPFQHRPASLHPPRLRVPRPTMLRTAISVLELVHHARQHPQAARFHWWYDMYPQWHPLAVALAELCAQTEGELVDRAWVVVEGAVPRLESMVADTRKGPLWRPVKKLLKKARGLRAEALKRRGGGVTHAPQGTNVAVVEENNDGVTDDVMLPAATELAAEPYAADAGDAQADLSFLSEPWQWDSAQELYDEWVAPVEGGDPSMDWTTWNEFLDDAQVEGSPSE